MQKLLLIFPFLFLGCASVSELPQSVSEAGFDSSREGKTGWAKQEDQTTFLGVSKRKTYDAAKAALWDADFTIEKADFEKGVITAEHGMTMVDWNIVAGVYLRETKSGIDVRVVAQGSKDLGFEGDKTNGNWPQKIFSKMRKYLKGDL